MARHRRFQLHRDADIGGLRRNRVVATGVQFYEPLHMTWPDGQDLDLEPGWCRVAWRGEYQSTVLWPSIEHVALMVGGAVRVVWTDPPQ